MSVSRTVLTQEQYAQLLMPLSAHRVAKRTQAGMSLSYLEAWDVKAHLIRIFGFGGWSADVTESVLAFEEKNEKGLWSVGYKVTLRLMIHDVECSYTESCVGFSSLGSRGEAHDMAVKTAESDALKRCAINLGTQFGLSLYDNGNKKDVVGMTLNAPTGYEQPAIPDRQLMDSSTADMYIQAILLIPTESELKEMWDELMDEGMLDLPWDDSGDTLRTLIGARVAEMRDTK